jgi:hypothetical protein
VVGGDRVAEQRHDARALDSGAAFGCCVKPSKNGGSAM